MAGLEEEIQPYLTQLHGDEAVLAAWRPETNGDDGPMAPLHLPTFVLNQGVELSQLNSIPAWMLWEFIQQPGFVVRLSNKIYAAFCNVEYKETLELRGSGGGDQSSKFVEAGPVMEAVAQDNWVDDAPWAVCIVYTPESTLPLTMDEARPQFEAIVPFLTGLPRFRSNQAFNRSLTIQYYQGGENVLRPQSLDLSGDCWNVSFGQDGWDETALLTIDNYQPTKGEWTTFEKLAFHKVSLLRTSVPWSFLQGTQSSHVDMDQVECDGHPQGIAPSMAELKIGAGLLESASLVDEFLHKWSRASKTIEINGACFSEESWRYLWRSPLWQGNAICTKLKVRGLRIQGRKVTTTHLDVLPKGIWVTDLAELSARVTAADIHARRTVTAISGAALDCFRPDTNPLFSEDRPLEPRQSIIHEALFRSQNNPDQAFQLAQVYTTMLTKPQSSAARAHDTETSLVELRALGIDHQAKIDLLLDVINRLHQQRAQDNQQLHRVLRMALSLEKEQLEARREQQRQDSRMQMLEEVNLALWTRLQQAEGPVTAEEAVDESAVEE